MKTIFMTAVVIGSGLILAGTAEAQTNQAGAERNVAWDGFYVGAHAAYHFGQEIDEGQCVGLCASEHEVREGYLALQAGYDARVGRNLIVGIMGWVGVTPVKSEAQLSPTVTVEGETDFAGFLGARVGVSSGAWLPYAFAGLEYVTGTVRNEAAPIKENKGEHSGIGVGVGVEYRMARNWSVDARYMYSDLGEDEYDFGGGATAYGEQAHTLSLGVNFRF